MIRRYREPDNDEVIALSLRAWGTQFGTQFGTPMYRDPARINSTYQFRTPMS